MRFPWIRFHRPGAGALLLLISACGGGGGGGGGGGPGGLPPSFFETEEYQANPGLAAIEASSAYADGATGDRIKVAVIDTGIDLDHTEFAGAIDPASVNIIGPAVDVDDPDGHGTAVAGVVGARRNGSLTHGVAFDSTLLAVRAAGTCDTGCVFDQSDVATATDYAVSRGARVINYSLGGAAVLTPKLETALARAADAGVILTFAAGNDGAAQPTFPARFAGSGAANGRAIAVGALGTDGRLASFSNRAGDTRDAFLAAPGVAIVAPKRGGGTGLFSGTSFAVPHVAGGVALILEAAPFLSAGQAVQLLLDTAVDLGPAGTDATYGHGLMDLAAALAPQGELGVPLGASADASLAPLGSSGLALGPAFGPAPALGEAIFLDGYGRPYRLDLGHRVRADDRRLDLLRWFAPRSRTRTASADFGAGATMRLSMAEEEPAADFPQAPGDESLQGFSLTTGLGPSAELTVMQDWPLGAAFGLANADPETAGSWLTPAVAGSPYLGFADGGDGLTLTGELWQGLDVRLGFAEDERSSGDLVRGSRRVAVAEVARTWDEDLTLAFQVGSLSEEAGLLGSAGGGAMALGGAGTSFLGLAARLPFPGLLAGSGDVHLFGHAHYGVTRGAGAGEGLIRQVDPLHSTAFAAGLASTGLFRDGDRLALAIAQPSRIHTGGAELDLPVGRAFDGTIERRSERVDLVPAGRELDLEVAYRARLAGGQELSVNWLTRIEPGHDPDQDPSHAVGVKWQTRF